MATSSTPKFEASRLTVARYRNGLTKAALADKVGVTLRMISLYEAGDKTPSPETLAKLAKVLGYPAAFFLRGIVDIPATEATSFRSLAKRSGLERQSALAAGALAFEFSDWIAERFNLPIVDVPDLGGMEPEAAGNLVRSQWGLATKPIPNTIHLLESHGVRVFSISEPSDTIDAFSMWRGEIPFIFLNTRKSAERSRHDAMHELGHLVLHRHGAPQGQVAEREADAFASATLLPRDPLLQAAVELPTLDELIRAKRHWRVSLASFVYRLHRIDAISDWHYHSLFAKLSHMGARRSEPEGIQRETSQVLEKVLAHLRRRNMSKADVASQLAIPYAELEGIVFGLVVSAVKGGGGSTIANTNPSSPRVRLSVVR